MLMWRRHMSQRYDTMEITLLDSYEAKAGGWISRPGMIPQLTFYITAVNDRFPEFLPYNAPAGHYILILGNQDLFVGTLQECQDDAERRAKHYRDKGWTQELLRPGTFS